MVYQLQRRPVAARGLISMATCTQSCTWGPFWRAERLSLRHVCPGGRTTFNLLSRHQRGKCVPKSAPTRVKLGKVCYRGLRSAFNMWHSCRKHQALKAQGCAEISWQVVDQKCWIQMAFAYCMHSAKNKKKQNKTLNADFHWVSCYVSSCKFFQNPS